MTIHLLFHLSELVRVDYADQLKDKLDAIVRCHQTVAGELARLSAQPCNQKD